MLTFKTVSWKNFLLAGQTPITFDLRGPGQTLIVGTNGVGKSTILDALSFGLYNKPFLDINKPQLVNTTNDREMVVTVECEIDGHDVVIVRGVKPTILKVTVDGVELPARSSADEFQKFLEQQWLRIDYKTFRQVVVLGAASYVPFMRLTAAQRRSLVEDLLDIQIFTTMATLAKERLAAVKVQTDVLRRQADDQQARIRMAEAFLRQQQTAQVALQAQRDQQRQDLEQQLQQSLVESETVQAAVDPLKAAAAPIQAERDRLQEYWRVAQSAEAQITKVRRRLAFYQDSTACSQCSQPITEAFKVRATEALTAKLDKVLAIHADCMSRYAAMPDVTARLQRVTQDLQTQQMALVRCTTLQSSLRKQIADLQKPLPSPPVAPEVDVEALRQAAALVERAQDDNARERVVYEHAVSLLRDDGIKAAVVRQYLPVINTNINRYLLSLDFPVQFQFDEMFQEHFLSPHRQDFTYGAFSEGQKKRIDMALLWTWRAVAIAKNSAATNLLILDEVCDSSLDADGIRNMFQILATLSTQTHVIVITPKGAGLTDQFQRVFEFTVRRGFSECSRVV
jgi:energy-coupling factor transporter ATP-binding protein EcfA2